MTPHPLPRRCWCCPSVSWQHLRAPDSATHPSPLAQPVSGLRCQQHRPNLVADRRFRSRLPDHLLMLAIRMSPPQLVPQRSWESWELFLATAAAQMPLPRPVRCQLKPPLSNREAKCCHWRKSAWMQRETPAPASLFCVVAQSNPPYAVYSLQRHLHVRPTPSCRAPQGEHDPVIALLDEQLCPETLPEATNRKRLTGWLTDCILRKREARP